MISINRVFRQLKKQPGYISVVELAMILEANTSEIRQRLNELGDRVTGNEHDEWKVTDDLLIHKLELSPLSASEIEERDELENTVQQAFYIAGQALKELRDRKLYRESHNRFEDYLRDRFDFTKRKAYYLINAYDVIENLKSEPLVHFLPTSERQCREVAKLPPEQQSEVWITSVEKAAGKVPPARIIRQVVKELREEPIMESKTKYVTEEVRTTPNMSTEYIIRADRETYELLENYRIRVGAATKLGAIKRLLNNEKICR